jgi:hypothetical protein
MPLSDERHIWVAKGRWKAGGWREHAEWCIRAMGGSGGEYHRLNVGYCARILLVKENTTEQPNEM